VVYGSGYWKEILNFDALVRWGMISPEDLKLFRFCDTPEEAFAYLRKELERHHVRAERGTRSPGPARWYRDGGSGAVSGV
jgi:predicted Rossmann-fold nucleotide-binding protein